MLKADLNEVIELAEEFGGLLEDKMDAVKQTQWQIQEVMAGKDVLEVVGSAMQIVLLGAEQMAAVNVEQVQKDQPEREWTQDDLFKMYVSALGLMMVNTAENGKVEEMEH